MKTFLAKKGEIERKWWLINAESQTLGRLSTQIAALLRGKTKPEFTPNVDTGDFVIVINAEKIRLTGKKELQKVYSRHSGVPGGFRTETVGQLRKRRPVKIIENAVRGMLPHNTLGEKQFTKLKVYQGENHPHVTQKPVKWEFKK
ncbi:MAG: 50S ribosomal protein L13 [Candidatus Melainabacteria bacterium RIFCSPLOWO2_02_FULL_35_15]|nr:MAG: 50S ribosomal protein L13 [Candidatus Melainabacteria bacterium RIFCSPLOWO2_12_FULL_35_11]OGI13212.1 MAG: 50S ribosomal protein L13 [Candidatus Melainabacteria bacterium RIFCSPLOWO2_02_FULL_35_15]